MSFPSQKTHLQGEINFVWKNLDLLSILKVFITQGEEQKQGEAEERGDEQDGEQSGGRQGERGGVVECSTFNLFHQ